MKHLGRMIVFVLVVCGLGPADAQTPTTAARADGKTFGQALKPRAATAAQTAPTAATLPNFTSNPAQQSYYVDPYALASDAMLQAPSSTGYQAVTSSINNRVQFDKATIDATLAPGKAVTADPAHYVSGYGGSQNSCHDLPTSGVSPGTYEQACNTGYSVESSDPSCAIPLNVTTSTQTVYNYECSDGPENNMQMCDAFSGCTQTGSRAGKCLQQGTNGCVEPGEPIFAYQCPSAIAGATLLSTDVIGTLVSAVPDTTACAGPAADSQCVADPDVCTSSAPVTRIVDGVSVTEPCWAWNRTYHCTGVSTATQTDCGQLEQMGCSFAREVCITDEMPCLTVDRIYNCPIPPVPGEKKQICDGDVLCMDGNCETIDRQPSADFGNAVVALNAASQAGKELDPATLTLFRGTRFTCSKTIFGITDCCAPRGIPIIGGGCNSEDMALKAEREKGVCAFVGTYCSSKFLGICLQKKEAHCCFASKISRILQEQGRVQIGKPWGNPKTEQCLGFTVAEFQLLDLSKMDFAEIYAEFEEAAKLPDEMTMLGEMQSKINAFYGAHH